MTPEPPASTPPPTSGAQAQRAIPSGPNPRSQRANKLHFRTYAFPIAGLALGVLFYVYSRTSIQAAKVNAQRHREADGGSISWRNEGLRRHGHLEKPTERTILSQLFSGGENDEASVRRRELENKRLEAEARRKSPANPIEEGIRRARDEKGKVKDKEQGSDQKGG